MHFFKNHRFLLIVTGFVCTLSLLGGAAFAQAATLSSGQIQAVLNLLQSFGVDQNTITTVQATLENQASVATTTVQGSGNTASANASCAILSGNLQPGSTDQGTGGEVSKLQTFLATNPSIYPQGLVTGYFGSDTLEAVQRWQAMHGIISSGNPTSTGYGYVGPKTRGEMDKEMEVECEGGASQGDRSQGSNFQEVAGAGTASSTSTDINQNQNEGGSSITSSSTQTHNSGDN